MPKRDFAPESGKPRSEEELPPELREEAKPEEKTESIAAERRRNTRNTTITRWKRKSFLKTGLS